jgi:DsbC/DsbD-like thiol-disulfide interchange protein
VRRRLAIWARAAVMLISLGSASLITGAMAAAGEPALVSPWVVDHNTRARLIAEGSPPGAPAGTIAAGIEIELAEGWKTYWRNPGSSGVPPTLNAAPSSNVASVDALYPAPVRLFDRAGDTIGYKGRVIFPVAVRPADASKPVALVLDFEYGVCKDICIPVQARLDLTIPPGTASKPASADLAKAFDAVPRNAEKRRATDPRLRTTKVQLTGDKPAVRLEVEYPGGAEGGDLFLEAPGGLWIPLANREGEAKGDVATFLVDLTDGADIADLKGKTIRATMVSPRGHSEATFKLE